MKATKFIVLVGGILGILAFFLPMVSIHRADFNGSVSAFQVIKGLSKASEVVSSANVNAAGIDSAVTSADLAQAKEGIDSMKGIVAAIFVPAILLTLIGGLAVKRKQFGRGAGALTLIFGLIGLGIATILRSAAEGDAGIALTLLLVTGLAGTVGGLLALVKPERLAKPVAA
ncbi:MAG TPA: hypothetical protein VM513_06050 [Kofleriaceae bacterium]|jgi:hypothetical protein|nr:hypothetical protein [Kofleriaceae bacterium]